MNTASSAPSAFAELQDDNAPYGQIDESWFDSNDVAALPIEHLGQGDELNALNCAKNAVIATIEVIQNNPNVSAHSVVAAESAMVALKSLLRISQNRSSLKSAFESFGAKHMSTSSARAYAKLAVEDWQNAAKAIIAKIIEWIKKAYAFVSENVFKSAKTAEEVSKRGAKLEVLSKEAAVKRLKDGATVDQKQIKNYFTVNGTPLSTDQIQQQYTKHTSTLGAQYTVTAITSISDGLMQIASAIEGDQKKDAVAQMTDALLTQLKTTLFKDFTDGHQDKASDDDFEILSHKLPFNNKSFVVIFGKETTLLNDVRVLMKDTVKQDPAEGELKPLGAGECVKLCKTVQDEMMLGIFKHHKELAAAIRKTENIVNKACDRIARKLQSSDHAERDNMLSVDFIKNIFTAIANLVGLLHNYDILSSSRILDYCEASLKCYED